MSSTIGRSIATAVYRGECRLRGGSVRTLHAPPLILHSRTLTAVHLSARFVPAALVLWSAQSSPQSLACMARRSGSYRRAQAATNFKGPRTQHSSSNASQSIARITSSKIFWSFTMASTNCALLDHSRSTSANMGRTGPRVAHTSSRDGLNANRPRLDLLDRFHVCRG